MLRAALRRLRAYAAPRAVVLMYHRIAEPESDVWDLAVSPANFEQHLQLLRQTGHVISAEELVSRLRRQTLKRRSIVITFDDGYGDNYRVAKPLLARYGLPATFFIPTGNMGQPSEFWWDELEAIFLLTEHLPPTLRLLIGEDWVVADLQAEQQLTNQLRQQHRQWRVAAAAPPTQRAAVFYEVWRRLKVLPQAGQQQAMQQLNAWAGQPAQARPAYQRMSADQVRELGHEPLFTIGAHTVSHPSLSSQPLAVQKNELATSQQSLSQLVEPVQLLAYPYGDYTGETSALAAELGFNAAFTTHARALTPTSALHQLGRFQVNNWAGDEFNQQLKEWFNG